MTDRPPNILMVVADQHSPHISGFAGNDAVDTPNLDRLRAKSAMFRHAVCQTPLCTPSRMSLLTGKLPQYCGGWANRSILTAEHRSIGTHLSEHGYATAYVGKMHIRSEVERVGFDVWPYGDVVTRAGGHQPDPLQTVDGRWNRHDVGRFPWAGISEIPESLLQERIVTRESLSLLLEHADSQPEKPWFLCASYSRPHFPLTTPGRYYRKYLRKGVPRPLLPDGFPDGLHPHDRYIVDNFHLLDFDAEAYDRAFAAYYACVEFVDACIGELLDGLEAAGLLENTAIVYTSDHGDMVGEHGLWWKRTYYEASVGVPLLIRLPGQRDARTVETVVELVDLFPTLCDVAGAPKPEGLDGESLLSLIEAGDDAQRKKRVGRSGHYPGRPEAAFRMVRNDRYKYVDFLIGDPVLFDLIDDPGERRNLAQESAYEPVVRRLQAELDHDGSWPWRVERCRADLAQAPPHRADPLSTNQFALADGRVIHVDKAMYLEA